MPQNLQATCKALRPCSRYTAANQPNFRELFDKPTLPRKKWTLLFDNGKTKDLLRFAVQTKYMIVATAAVTLPTLYLTGSRTDGLDTPVILSGVAFSCALLYSLLVSYNARNIACLAYVSPSGKTLRVSQHDILGRQLNRMIPVNDIAPHRAHLHPNHNILGVNLSSGQKGFCLQIPQTKIYDQALFNEIFGTIYDNYQFGREKQPVPWIRK